MRMTRSFGETLRKAPSGVEDPVQALLLRAAYIRQLAPGLFSYLPTGHRALLKLEGLAREELRRIGALEVALPVVQPQEIWRRSGSLARAGQELARFTDRLGRPLLISPSNEAAVAELARSEIGSYRQLPLILFQIRRVFRDEERKRGGLLRVREFTLLDSYVFARDTAELAGVSESQREAFNRILARLELTEGRWVGRIGVGEGASELELIHPLESADDRALVCDACRYGEKLELARFARPQPPQEHAAPLEKVATPGADTIASLAELLSIGTERTAKVVLYSALFDPGTRRAGEERVVLMALVRGDMEASEAKLAAATGTFDLRPADADDIRRVGAEPGYASPIGLDAKGLVVAVDETVAASANLVSGANEEGFHYLNVNHGRDYRADIVADIAAAPRGARCAECGSPLRIEACTELASLHHFPRTFGERIGLSYQNESGGVEAPYIASAGIGLDRLLACLSAVHRDDRGLRLPDAVAPFSVALISLPAGDAELEARADALYVALQAAGFDVLYDDRDASPGVKFNDADLIGIPLRLTLGPRSMQEGGVEVKRRDTEARSIVSLEDVASTITRMIGSPVAP